MTSTSAAEYVACETTMFRYPPVHPPPPGGAKVQLLTTGGVCVLGHWKPNAGFIAWAPLAKRDKQLEKQLAL